jgi:(E)-4-hydroxy-3-methylbut-2-enyl-diphosphate synthase
MIMKKQKSRVVMVGKIPIGGGNPVVIQSMTKVRTADFEKAIKQIIDLEKAGCEIVRLALKDREDLKGFKKIKSKVHIPLVADIHFDYKFALMAIDCGADKIRLNPGNIYKKEEVKEVISALKSAKIPLRIGLNSGSVQEPGSSRMAMPDKLVESALAYIKMVEGFKFHDIVVSLKASNVIETILAYRKFASVCDYPLHLGVTATGFPYAGAIKSSIALGVLLLEGIGDTIRVSLTDKPTREVYTAKVILESLGLRSFGPEIISCPTCGRCEVNLVKLVNDFENKASSLKLNPIKVALMGCVVNGPGEAKEAEIGVAFGKEYGLLFKHGKAIKKVHFSECVDSLLKEMENKHG